MKDRIRLIMDKEELTPAKFADRLQINRAIISHILNGRNNPSLDVVTKILSEMEYINPEWLLNGNGSMYKEGYSDTFSSQQPDLFNQIASDLPKHTEFNEKPKEMGFKPPEKPNYNPVNKVIEPVKTDVRKVKQIIIYYSDNTFEMFEPHGK